MIYMFFSLCSQFIAQSYSKGTLPTELLSFFSLLSLPLGCSAGHRDGLAFLPLLLSVHSVRLRQDPTTDLHCYCNRLAVVPSKVTKSHHSSKSSVLTITTKVITHQSYQCSVLYHHQYQSLEFPICDERSLLGNVNTLWGCVGLASFQTG